MRLKTYIPFSVGLMNGILTFLSAFSGFLLLIGQILHYSGINDAEIPLNLLYAIFAGLGGLHLFIYSGLRKSQKFLIPVLSAAIVLAAGVLMMKLDLSGGRYLLLLGGIGLPTIYGLRYQRKKRKTMLDNLKLLWVFSLGLSLILYMNDWDHGEWAILSSQIIFGTLIFLFLRALSNIEGS